MASIPIEFQTVVTDNFTVRMARAAEAAKLLGDLFALRQATWEPHDWSTF